MWRPLTRGAKLERDLLRALAVVERQFGLADLPAVLVEKRLNHAARQADGVDRAGHPGHVVQHQPIGAIDAGHLNVAVGGVARAGWRPRHAVDDHAHLARQCPADCRPNCGCRRKAESPRRLRLGGTVSAAAARARQQRGGLARRRQSRQLLGPVEQPRPVRQTRSARRSEIVLELLAPFFSLPRAWLKRVTPEASSAMLIEADVSSRKISAGFSVRLVLIAEHGPEQQQHNQHNGRHVAARAAIAHCGRPSVPNARS